MTNEEFLEIMKQLLSNNENREIFVAGYLDCKNNLLKPNFEKHKNEIFDKKVITI